MVSKCPICINVVAHLEEHHIIPREYGGKDLPTINICSTCHRGLHNQAKSISSGSRNLYFTSDIWPRAKRYVYSIIEAKKNYEITNNKFIEKRIIIHVSDELLRKLHRLKKYKGYSSLERFIKHILEDLVSGI